MMYDKQFDPKYERKAIARHALQTRAIGKGHFGGSPLFGRWQGKLCGGYEPLREWCLLLLVVW